MKTSVITVAILAAFITSSAHADALDQTWLTTGFASHHLGHHDEAAELGEGKEYNEANHGLGLEYTLDSGNAIAVGLYSNSINATTHYALYIWRPLHYGNHLSAGVALGAINGYDHYHNGGYGPAVVPTGSVEYKHVGANIVYVPPIKGVDSVIAIQLKFKF